MLNEQDNLKGLQMISASVSSVRQPIESLFNWINELTGLQKASKTRATNGLFVHIFLAIAICHNFAQKVIMK